MAYGTRPGKIVALRRVDSQGNRYALLMPVRNQENRDNRGPSPSALGSSTCIQNLLRTSFEAERPPCRGQVAFLSLDSDGSCRIGAHSCSDIRKGPTNLWPGEQHVIEHPPTALTTGLEREDSACDFPQARRKPEGVLRTAVPPRQEFLDLG